MEVHCAPEIEKQLNDLAAQSGRGTAELVRDAVAGYIGEVHATRGMLDSRYDDIRAGRVRLLDGKTLSRAYMRTLKRGAIGRMKSPNGKAQ